MQTKYALSIIVVLAGSIVPGRSDEVLGQRGFLWVNYSSTFEAASKGSEQAEKGDYEKARQYYTAAIGQDPKEWWLYLNRAMVFTNLEKWDLALQDLNTVLRTARGALMAQVLRGQIYEELGKYSLALADYDRIASITPASLPLTRAFAHNSRAWLRATCPDASFRNGKQAVADTKSACNEASWSEPAYMDTLAAAHAEAGDFDSAVRFEQRAIKSVHEETWAIKDPERRRAFHERQFARYQRRLAAYERHQPWRSNLH